MQIIKPFVTVEIVGLPNDSATQRTDTKLFYVSLSFAFVPLSERNSQRGAHERHKAGEKRVGVRRRAGRWV